MATAISVSNRVSLLMTPREIGDGDITMWQLARVQRIGARTSLSLNLHFTDELQQPVGLLELERVHSAFHRDAEGKDRPITDRVSARTIEIGFSSLQVQLENSSARDVFLTELSVIGKPLYRRDPLELTVSDGAGIHLHGLRHLSLDLPRLIRYRNGAGFCELRTRATQTSGRYSAGVAARCPPTSIGAKIDVI